MKKYIVSLGICSVLICSVLTISVVASEQTVRLPIELVTMQAENGTKSWFDITLLNVPQGYDVTNGLYPGWCIQRDKEMSRGVNHSVYFYSSYDSALSENFSNNNWNKINYVINNKQGASKYTIQQVIWWYICQDPVSDNDTLAKNIIANADLNGDFVPSSGEFIAILIDGGSETQRSFFELRLPNLDLVVLGDFVWNDLNANGIQDAGEPGIPGINVSLYTEDGKLEDFVFTDIHGYYSFGIFPLGKYYIKFTLPSGYRFSPKNQGADYTKDSDADPQTGKTNVFTFDPEEYNNTLDAGMYEPDESGIPKPPQVLNFPPTADGTAGEPYVASFGTVIIFNGSRSYDRDGTIVSWHWSFGDGTTANGSVVKHNYTNPGTYVVTLIVTDNNGATDSYTTKALSKPPNRPPLSPILIENSQGRTNVSYLLELVTTDPDDDDVRYIITWGDGSQNNTPFFRSGQNAQILHQYDNWGFYTIQAYAQDPSNATSNISSIVVAVNVQYIGTLGYLIDVDSSGSFDAFYSNITQNITKAEQQTGIYLIDTNGDGNYDYQYDPRSGTYGEYPETPSSIYMMLIVGISAVILVLLIAFFMNWRRKKSS